MCLSVVGTIEIIEGSMAYVEIQGLRQWICIDLIEEAQIGEELLIHAGCGISRLVDEESKEIKAALREFEKGSVHYYGADD